MKPRSVIPRRAFVASMAGGLLAARRRGEAQQVGRIYRVGILGQDAADATESRQWQAFRQVLRERGWNEGTNLQIEYRWVEGDANRLTKMATELVQLRSDVLVARGSFFTAALKAATSSIPIVTIAHADPVGTGHVASLARPGGNVTGVALLQTELGPKGLELLKTVVPAAARIAVLWHPGTPSAAPGLKALEEPGRQLRLHLQPVAAQTAKELDGAFSAMAREGAQALLVLGTPFFFNTRQRIAELAVAHRLPSVFQGRPYVEAGGLVSYFPDHEETLRRGAVYVDKILKGAKPPDLPVEQPTKLELVINLKTAKALGLKIPQSVLVRADEVIQ